MIAAGLASGKEALAAGNYSQSRKHFEEVLRLDGENQEALSSLEEIDRLVKERDRDTSAPGPSYKTIGIFVGVALSIMLVVAAVYLIRSEQRTEPDTTMPVRITQLLELGQKALVDAHIEQARQHFEEVRNLDSENREADRWLEEVVRIENDIYFSLVSGKEALAAGNYSQSRQRFEEVLKLDRNNKEAQDSLKKIARLEEGVGQRMAAALESGKEALAAGNYSQAREHFNAVLKLDRNNKEAQDSLEYIASIVVYPEKKLELEPKSISFGKIGREGQEIEQVVTITSHLGAKTMFLLSDVRLRSMVQWENIDASDFFYCKRLQLNPNKSKKLRCFLQIPPDSELPDGEYNGELIFKYIVSAKYKTHSIPFIFVFKP